MLTVNQTPLIGIRPAVTQRLKGALTLTPLLLCWLLRRLATRHAPTLLAHPAIPGEPREWPAIDPDRPPTRPAGTGLSNATSSIVETWRLRTATHRGPTHPLKLSNKR